MIKIENVSAKVGSFELKQINLKIEKGEYFVLLGPSGAGKSILFEVLAGIYPVQNGSVIIDDTNITRAAVNKRGLGLVFQDNTLFPNLSVEKNIGYSLRSRKLQANILHKKINEITSSLNINHLLNREVSTLSGGEIQRVSLARAMISQPQYLLLDEPLSSIDIQLRGELMNLLKKINQTGITIIHITHDLEEAIRLADRIAFMENGEIIQIGKPNEIFSKPKNEFVARFLNFSNIFVFDKVNDAEIILNEKVSLSVNLFDQHAQQVVIPNESIHLSGIKTESDNCFEGVIKSIVDFPESYELTVDIGIPIVYHAHKNGTFFIKGEKLWLSIESEKLILIRKK